MMLCTYDAENRLLKTCGNTGVGVGTKIGVKIAAGIGVEGTKREMHDWQHEKILEYKAEHGGQRPPLNKSDW